MEQGFTRLSAQDFFDAPLRTRTEAIDAMAREGFEGLAMDAPGRVAIDRFATLPVLLGRRFTLAQDLGANLRTDALVAVTHLERNYTHIAHAFEWKDPAGDAPRPRGAGGVPGGGYVASVVPVELRERVPEIPWGKATLLITGLLGVYRSNRTRVKLGTALGEDPEVTAFVARNRAVGYPRPVWPPRDPGAAFPSYEPIRESGGSGGGSLGVEGGFDADTVDPRAKRCVFRARFRLPVMDREIVRERDPYEDEIAAPRGFGWTDVGDPSARAVVPITLVMASAERTGPRVLRLQVPSATEVSPDEAGCAVEGRFAVDLAALGALPRDVGRHHLWAFSGEFVAGPWVLTVRE